MLEKIKYVNHLNEVIEFGKNGLYAQYNNLRDYSWEHEDVSGKIASFKKSISSYNLDVVISNLNVTDAIKTKNRLFEVVEKDVILNTPGKLIINDYYLKCFVVGSQKKNYLLTKQQLELTLNIITDDPLWKKENIFSFRDSEHDNYLIGLNYPYDFSFDFTNYTGNKKINNSNFAFSNFKINIYGPCNNPSIYISDHQYKVNTSILAGEYLIINSIDKTIKLIKNDGSFENKFNNRYRDSYIFEPIKAGENAVNWSGEFGFDIIVFDERSEPKWI